MHPCMHCHIYVWLLTCFVDTSLISLSSRLATTPGGGETLGLAGTLLLPFAPLPEL